MSSGQVTFQVLALVSIAVAVLALGWSIVLSRRVRALRRAVSNRRRPAELPPLDGGETDLRTLALELEDLRDVVARSVQCLGVVRFDAFEDLGGRLSFAAALLDAGGSGVVLSAIHGRSETRVYAKPVERGGSRVNLSGEEQEAIRRALGVVRQ